MNVIKQIDWNRILYINPKNVTHGCGNLKFNLNQNLGVEDGDWDNARFSIERSSRVYTSIYAMINESAAWESTPLYEWMIKNVETNNVLYQRGCNTKESVLLRGKQITELIQKLMECGELKNQKQLSPSERINEGVMDEVNMAIDRNGKFLFAGNGIHRFCISKILGFKKIPVLIYKRHKQWEIFKEEVDSTCNDFWNKKAYQELPHPDFADTITEWDDTRYNIIKPMIHPESKTLLDIGSMFGHFCHKFENDGYSCTAVENLQKYLSILHKLRDASNLTFSIFPKSVFELDRFDYDIIFAFNVFHHFIKSEESHAKLVALLNNLNYSEMYVQLHTPSEKQMVDAYRNYNNEEFINFIIKHSKNKTRYQFVADVRGRNIYKIY